MGNFVPTNKPGNAPEPDQDLSLVDAPRLAEIDRLRPFAEAIAELPAAEQQVLLNQFDGLQLSDSRRNSPVLIHPSAEPALLDQALRSLMYRKH